MRTTAIRGVAVSLILGLSTVSLAQDNPPPPDPVAQLERELEQARRELAEVRVQSEQAARQAAEARERAQLPREQARPLERDHHPHADHSPREPLRPENVRPARRERLMERLQELANERNALLEHGADPDRVSHIEDELRRVSREMRGPGERDRGERREVLRQDSGIRFQQKRQRLEHLRAAVQHLRTAELHDLAQEVRQRADEFERDLQVERMRIDEARDHEQAANAAPRRDIHRELDELRQELRTMRRELHEQIRSPSPPSER